MQQRQENRQFRLRISRVKVYTVRITIFIRVLLEESCFFRFFSIGLFICEMRYRVLCL